MTEAKMTADWQPVGTIPRDRVIEVQAPPHSEESGSMLVIWDPQKPPYCGGWRWATPRGSLAFPIYPTAWREVSPEGTIK